MAPRGTRPRSASLLAAALLAAGTVSVTAPSSVAGPRLGPVVRIRTPGESRCPAESEPTVVVTRAGTWVAYNDMHQCYTPVANRLTSVLSLQLIPAGGGAPRYLRVEPRTPGAFHSGDPALAPDPAGGDGVVVSTLQYQGDAFASQTTVQVYRVSPSFRVTWLGSPSPPGTSDKELVATDTSPRSPYRGRTYVVWDQRGTDPGLLFRAHDGRRWRDPVRVASPGGHPDVAVAPDGTIAVAWESSRGVEVRISRDGGATFGAQQSVVKGRRPGRHDAACPLMPVVGVRQRATMAVRAVYDAAGRLHVVASVGRHSWNPDVIPPPVGVNGDDPGVVVHASTADGRTWRAAPVDPEHDAVQFHSIVARTPDGGVAVGWLQQAGPTAFDAYVAVAAPGRPFARPIRMSPRPAHFVLATEAMLTTGCYGIGDYVGLATSPRGVVLAWPTTEGDVPSPYDTDVLVRELYLR